MADEKQVLVPPETIRQTHIIVKAAQPRSKDEPKKHVVIEVGPQAPIETLTVSAADTLFENEAEMLEDALSASLPGGTYDRLLGYMLQRKASHLVVAHGRGKRESQSERLRAELADAQRLLAQTMLERDELCQESEHWRRCSNEWMERAHKAESQVKSLQALLRKMDQQIILLREYRQEIDALGYD